MVNKTIVVTTILMTLMATYNGSVITNQQPQETPVVDSEKVEVTETRETQERERQERERQETKDKRETRERERQEAQEARERLEKQEVAYKKEATQPTAISPYDPIFKSVCEDYGNDWRFMSAMAYHESRFQPDIASHKGALGMMQIMPSVAEFFNVKSEDLTNVETNIIVANLLVNRISKMLKLTNEIPERDRMGLILASYNGGIGYVLNARSLARSNGEDVNSWSVVSRYLREMKSEEFASTNNVRRFVGVSQTIAYVDNVIGHYNLYCQLAAL